MDTKSGGGGVDRMRDYIKDSANAIRSRRNDAAVVVVLDWDAAGKQNSLKNLLALHPPTKFSTWPVDFAKPEAGVSCRGLERFHCNRVLSLPSNGGAKFGRISNEMQRTSYMVEAAGYAKVKAAARRDRA